MQVIEEDAGSFVIQSDRAAPSGLPFERVQIIDGQLAGAHPDSIIAMLDGSRAELMLRPARVLFRPLELPQRATEFLDGVVRAADRSPDAVDRERRGVRLERAGRGGRRPHRDHGRGDRARAGAAAGRRAGRGRRGGGRRHRRATRCRADHRARPSQRRGTLDVARVRRALVAVLIVTGLLAGVSLSVAAARGG